MRVLLLALVAMFCFQVESKAQLSVWNDTIMVFRPNIIKIQGFNLSGSENFVLASQSQVISKSTQVTGVSHVSNPLILKRNGKCFRIQCFPGTVCKECTLFWKDRNGDGKINPAKELRCSNSGSSSGLKWDQIQCRN